MSCRKNFWKTSCERDPGCIWQENSPIAKRHMIFHAWEVLLRIKSSEFSSRGVCRRASTEETSARSQRTLDEANRRAEMESKAANEKFDKVHRAMMATSGEINRARGEMTRDLEESRRKHEDKIRGIGRNLKPR